MVTVPMIAGRMLTGAIVLVTPTIAFLFAFGGWISWPVFFGVAFVCVMVGSSMSIAK